MSYGMSCMCAYASCKHTHTHVFVLSIGRQHARRLDVASIACIFKRSPAPAHDLLQAEPFACWSNPFLSRALRLLFDRFVMGSAARALDSCQRSRGRARAPPHIRCAQQAGDWLEEGAEPCACRASRCSRALRLRGARSNDKEGVHRRRQQTQPGWSRPDQGSWGADAPQVSQGLTDGSESGK